MKEIEVVPGDSVYEIFRKAWLLYWKLKREPVCFHHNDSRIVIMFDESNSETQILTHEEAKAIVEASEEDQK